MKTKPRVTKMKAKPTKESGVGPHGYDYGCLPPVAAGGVYEFPNLLSKSEVVGVGYGEAWAQEINHRVPAVSLICTNGAAMLKAFEVFQQWAEVTDGDSLSVTFILRRSGGYILALSPEAQRLKHRCVGYSRTHSPVLYFETWHKSIDTTHPAVASLRAYASGPITPIYLDASTISGALAPSRQIAGSPKLKRIEGLKPLLKFEIAFVDEADAVPGTAAWVALQAVSVRKKKKLAESSYHPTLKLSSSSRFRALRTHYPVTVERLARSLPFWESVQYLLVMGFARWQIEQAVCNLVLSHDMGLPPHFLGVDRSEVDIRITEMLGRRFEIADNEIMPVFALPVLEAQLLLDVNALLRFLSQKSAKSLAQGISALGMKPDIDHGSALDALGLAKDVV